jgi:Cys-tRNA(Pro)/Cys-tRNA(Cys) deacylase
MTGVNNITRMLDQRKIPYTAFDLPAEKLGALETARLLGVSPDIVFKTIVVTRSSKGVKPILAIIPGNCETDLKALAYFLNEKKVMVPAQHEAETITGMQAGGISPLGLVNRGFIILLDQSAAGLTEMHISGGQRGLNIRLEVKDLIKLTQARLAPISVRSNADESECIL